MTHPSIIHCPAWVIAGTGSNQGKTTVAAALARHHRDKGLRVRAFKLGPDFLDPMILERASGHPVHQLDLWMVGEAASKRLLHEAACEADLILIEGMMGLFDGEPSCADFAQTFGIPVMAVIDASGMAETFGALASGLANFRPGLSFAGVFANRVGSSGHADMLRESLPSHIPWLGWMPRQPGANLPERHLGLLQASEMTDLDERIEQVAEALQGITDVLPEPVAFQPPKPVILNKELAGARIGIARDEAFGFVYPANIDTLQQLGADFHYFSPLKDTNLPPVDALYFPGGYPELHLESLAANQPMIDAIRTHHKAAKPIVAECGGMLYLLDKLSDTHGNTASLVGLIPGEASLQPQLCNIGLHTGPLPEGDLRGHTFHHSQMTCPLNPLTHTLARRHHGKPEPIYRLEGLTASYMHWYFASNPEASASLFKPSSCNMRPLQATP